MPEHPLSGRWWGYVVAGAIIGLAIGTCLAPRPDTELAHATREAVELARDAQQADRSAVLWAGRYRLLALIIGVSVPLMVAYLIWRASSDRELDSAELIEAVEQYVLEHRIDASPRLPEPITGAGENQLPDATTTTAAATTTATATTTAAATSSSTE